MGEDNTEPAEEERAGDDGVARGVRLRQRDAQDDRQSENHAAADDIEARQFLALGF